MCRFGGGGKSDTDCGESDEGVVVEAGVFCWKEMRARMIANCASPLSNFAYNLSNLASLAAWRLAMWAVILAMSSSKESRSGIVLLVVVMALVGEIVAAGSAAAARAAVAAVEAWAVEDLFGFMYFPMGAAESGPKAVESASEVVVWRVLSAVAVAAALVWPPGYVAMFFLIGS